RSRNPLSFLDGRLVPDWPGQFGRSSSCLGRSVCPGHAARHHVADTLLRVSRLWLPGAGHLQYDLACGRRSGPDVGLVGEWHRLGRRHHSPVRPLREETGGSAKTPARISRMEVIGACLLLTLKWIALRGRTHRPPNGMKWVALREHTHND